MNHDHVQDTVEFYFNGEAISGTLFTYFDGVTERQNTFMFNYKGYTIHISLKEDQKYYFVAPKHCEIIDKLGIEGHKKYEDNLSTVHSIERDFVVINEKVYNYYCKLIVHSPKVYYLDLLLEDGTHLDGTNKLTDMNTRGNKRQMIKNLQYQAQDYFKRNKIEPSKDFLNKEKTNEYEQAKKIIKEIIESL
ncbi:hypothetical protein [Bacillus norwichensis]|uniref:Uncharacterized protein n=1 Tax=Bacillus norwichensis TaxID=2762217 RepID=A0ABR8VNT2_9BACI|nr:hypothetical protein [Bacillus norwichensis]MBD8006419.1 hypothetical protein [Bacillus norwichensis]